MKLTETAKKMILVICILVLALIAASAIYYRSLACLPFAFGALLGAGLNVLRVIMLDRLVGKVMNMEKKQSGNYMRFQFFSRFILTGLVLVLAVMVPFISLWGTVASIFTFPLAAFSMKFFQNTDVDAKY